MVDPKIGFYAKQYRYSQVLRPRVLHAGRDMREFMIKHVPMNSFMWLDAAQAFTCIVQVYLDLEQMLSVDVWVLYRLLHLCIGFVRACTFFIPLLIVSVTLMCYFFAWCCFYRHEIVASRCWQILHSGLQSYLVRLCVICKWASNIQGLITELRVLVCVNSSGRLVGKSFANIFEKGLHGAKLSPTKASKVHED